jgi:FkbM family methyltransferase
MKKHIYIILSKLGYKIRNERKEKKRKLIFIKQFDVIANINLLLKSYRYIYDILLAYPELKISDCNNGVLFIFNGLEIYIETVEEIFIIDEVFVKMSYNFIFQDKTVLIDVGANVGIASLFFSKQDSVDKIYAFEPMDVTFNQAKNNFKRNHLISKVTCFFNIGLANSNREDVFKFNPNCKGNTGFRGELSPNFVKDLVTEKKVILKDASVEIKKIVDDNPSSKIVIKMDCEGAEYEILENINQSGIIRDIDYLLIEWHDKGAQDLEDILYRNGFNFFGQNLSNNAGMIYAFKK